MIITIDGPMASGKSSIARMLARDLSIYYLYSGLLYRALGYLLVRDYQYTEYQLLTPNIDHVIAMLHDPYFIYSYSAQQGASITMRGVNITPGLKTSEVDMYSSLISVHEHVRLEILQFQRNLAQQHHLIADGRDCGTVVFPGASHKFFLTADPEVRAARWQRDQVTSGKEISFEDALQAVLTRDGRDTHRTHSPLKPAHDARIVDNSALNLEQTLAIFKTHFQLYASQAGPTAGEQVVL